MKMSDDNYEFYKILGCNKDSSHEKIKRAYHKLALVHHPDKNTGKSPTDNTFVKIEAAWRILGNAEARKKYDAECRQAELESDNILIYDRINLNDLKIETDELLSFPCRCGNNYLINKSDLAGDDETIHVPCQECTFFIAVCR